ncbi:MAG: hypothetical protein ACLFNU_04470 [Bacteroidales bacterium]
MSEDKEKCGGHHNGTSSAIYGLGLIGAAIYYISAATSFWMGVLGFLKALVWPVFFVYEALKSFGA